MPSTCRPGIWATFGVAVTLVAHPAAGKEIVIIGAAEFQQRFLIVEKTAERADMPPRETSDASEQTSDAGKTLVSEGDTIVWKSARGNHGVVFDSKETAESFLEFETEGLPELCEQQVGKQKKWGTSAGKDSTTLVRATVKKGATGSLAWSFYRAHVLVLPDPTPELSHARDLKVTKVVLSISLGSSPADKEAVDVDKPRTGEQERQAREKVFGAETGEAFVTLKGDPTKGKHRLLRFLRDSDRPSIIRLHHPILRMTSNRFDKDYAVVARNLHTKLRVKMPPFKNARDFLFAGMHLQVLDLTGEDQPVEGRLIHFHEEGDALFIKNTDKVVKKVTLAQHMIIALPDDGQFEEAERIAAAFRQPNSLSVRIDWDSKEVPEKALPFEVTYKQRTPKWSMRYELTIRKDPTQSYITPWATIHNRTAYDWENVDVVLRDKNSGKVEYRLDRVNLDSQKVGLFRINTPNDSGIDAKTEKLLLFNANDHESKSHPRQTLQVTEAPEMYLVSGPLSIFSEQKLLSDGEELETSERPKTYEYEEDKFVTVKYSPDKFIAQEHFFPYWIVRRTGEQLAYYRAGTRTYTVANKGQEMRTIRIKLKKLADNWSFDPSAFNVAYSDDEMKALIVDPTKKGKADNPIEYTVKKKDGISVAKLTWHQESNEVVVVIQPGATAPFRFTRVDRGAKRTDIDLRVASAKELSKLALGSDLNLTTVNEVRIRRAAIEKAKKMRTERRARLTKLESEYYEYPVITSSAANIRARRELQTIITQLQGETQVGIGTFDQTISQLEAEIDRILFGSPEAMVEPPAGKLYHGVFPPVSKTEEEKVTLEQTLSYEQAVGKKVAWVLMVYDLFEETAVADDTYTWIVRSGKTPFIRLRLHPKKPDAKHPDTLQEIIDGKLDAKLKAWAYKMRALGWPAMVEFGPECNGHWNSWSGIHNGGGTLDKFGDPTKPDEPERFVKAYRHVVQLVRDGAGASNITWVFHVNQHDNPGDKPWNRLENYYPGNDVVDWVGVSIYGAQYPDTREEVVGFTEQMDEVYQRFQNLAPEKPVIVAELGSTAGHPSVRPEDWANEALTGLLQRRWPRVIGFNWWNERWSNGPGRSETNMRVQDSPELSNVIARLMNRYSKTVQQAPMSRPAVATESE